MGFKDNNWVKGCGIGCGALVLLGVVVFVAGGLWVRGVFDGVRELSDSQDKLAEIHGAPGDYVPAADQSIPPQRIEIFLAVRDTMSSGWDELERACTALPDKVESARGGPRKIFAALTGLAGMVNPIAEHLDRRNELLLDVGMSLGEYLHIYTTAYYGWLGKDPGTGPVTELDGVREEMFSDEDAMYSRERCFRVSRRLMLDFLRNAIRSLPAEGEPGGDPVLADRLAAELRRCELQPKVIPWTDGLPAAAEASLDPYRDRLFSAWNGPSNCFELPRDFNRSWEIHVD